jgi:hypothetical protein
LGEEDSGGDGDGDGWPPAAEAATLGAATVTAGTVLPRAT